MVAAPHPDRPAILENLINRCEGYLRGRGAIDLRIGSYYPFSPFYLGLYGGSNIPGILSNDSADEQLYLKAGYEALDRCLIYARDIKSFRPPVDRDQLQHRRRFQVVPEVNPQGASWWDACVFGPTDQIRFVLHDKTSGAAHGKAVFWDMGPLSSRWQANAMGMIHFEIDEEHRRQGLGTFMLAEALNQLQTSGISEVQTQIRGKHSAARHLLDRLRFTLSDHGTLYGK